MKVHSSSNHQTFQNKSLSSNSKHALKFKIETINYDDKMKLEKMYISPRRKQYHNFMLAIVLQVNDPRILVRKFHLCSMFESFDRQGWSLQEAR